MPYKIFVPLEIILGTGLLQIRREDYAVRIFLTGFADIIVVIHFAWILFMLAGFVLTIRGFWHRRFFDRWLFRTVHLCGIAYVGLLAFLREYCPLTILENTVRAKYNPDLTYPGSFIVYYIEKLVYPDVNPLVILIPTIIIAVFTIVAFIIKPPTKIRKIFKWREA